MLEDLYCGNSDAIRLPLKLLYVVGLHPGEKFKMAKCLFLINLTIFGLVACFGIIGVYASFSLGFTNISDSLQSTALMLQLFVTCASIFYHQDLFYQILNDTKQFIKLEDFWHNREVYLDCKRVLKIARNSNIFYLILCAIIALFFDTDPLISGNLPFAGYIPNDQWKPYLIVIHEYAAFLVYAHLMGFDTCFICISSETIVQFKLLKEKIRQLSSNNKQGSPIEFQKQLKFIVDHHNFLINYINKICIFSSEIFLLQFLLTVTAGCVQLFIILEKGFPIEDKIKTIIFFFGQIYEFALYCLSSEIISSTASQLADAAFYSNWYKNSNHNYHGRDILMIIRRSQMDFVFTGGNGFVRLNLATFTVVFKSCLSFYTSIKAMELKKYSE